MNEGAWGIVGPHQIDLVHPDDRGLFKSNWTSKAHWLFRLAQASPDYCVFDCGKFSVRAKREAFVPVAKVPDFLIGDSVMVVEKGKTAKVWRLEWHFGKADFMYYLEIDARKSNCRYFIQDLKPVVAG